MAVDEKKQKEAAEALKEALKNEPDAKKVKMSKVPKTVNSTASCETW